MWRLFTDYYTDVTRATFDADLASKSHVILLHNSKNEEIKGFSTLHTYRRTIQGRKIAVLYSGDTIIDQAYWGQTALQRAWLSNAMRLKLSNPHLPVYWFLISKGYKTYLLLSRNFPEYWPRHDRPLPVWERAVLDTLASEKFGDDYSPELGLIMHDNPAGRLASSVAPIDEALLRYPDIRFFCEKNPGHANGDELCCIGRIDGQLWLSYMVKLSRRLLKRKKTPWGGPA